MTVERLDFSKPPPGYELTTSCGVWVSDPDGELIREDESFADEDDALAAAWAHHEARDDPPGMWAGQARGEHEGGYGFGLMGRHDHQHALEADFERIDEARAAAWAWYKRRLALEGPVRDRLDDERADCPACGGEAVAPNVIATHEDVCTFVSHDIHDDGGGRCNTCGAELAACPACGPYHGRKPPLEVWPRCLTWTDEQVAEVERWLVDGGEMPAVLGGECQRCAEMDGHGCEDHQ